MEEREELTELELNSIAYHDGRLAGERAGRLAGERAGRVAGQRTGEQLGRLAERAELLLTVLQLRGLSLDAEREGQIRSCDDLDRLARWVERAKRATELADVFSD